MRTYRFFRNSEWYVLVSQPNDSLDTMWRVDLSTYSAMRVGTEHTKIIPIQEWLDRSSDNFGVEFESETLKEALEKVFVEIL